MDARQGVIVTFFVEKEKGFILPKTCQKTRAGVHPFQCSSASKTDTVLPSRKETWVYKIGAIVCTAFFLSTLSHAQIPSGGNVFFGYSYSRGNTFTQSSSAGTGSSSVNMNGWEASLEGKYLPWLGVVADLDWHYGSERVAQIQVSASRHQIMFGPRASMARGRYTPFAQVLIGVAHQSDSGTMTSESDTSFATAIGGGVDYNLLKVVAARGQLDYLHTSLLGDSQGHIRLSVGLVFRF
jgi:opacity protein-like surface antigen